MDQRFALVHELIVVDVKRDDETRHLRRNRHRASIRIGVVGGLNVAGGEIEIAAAGDRARRDEQADEQKRALFFGRQRFLVRRGFVRLGALFRGSLGELVFRRPLVPLAKLGFGLLIHPEIRSTVFRACDKPTQSGLARRPYFGT